MYEIFWPDTVMPKAIRRTTDGAIIPVDAGNRDFQEFLVWNSQQETPLVYE